MEIVRVCRPIKSGGSWIITIPKEVAEEWKLKKEDKLAVYYDRGNRRLVIEKSEKEVVG